MFECYSGFKDFCHRLVIMDLHQELGEPWGTSLVGCLRAEEEEEEEHQEREVEGSRVGGVNHWCHGPLSLTTAPQLTSHPPAGPSARTGVMQGHPGHT